MSTAAERLQLYLDAEAAILSGGQEVLFQNRRVTRADLPAIQSEIAKLRREVSAAARVAAGGSGTRFAVADFS